MVLLTIVKLPFRIIKWPLGFLPQGYSKYRFDLPPAGLDEAKAELIMYALRRSATTPEEETIAEKWLSSFQIAQVAMIRLLAELHSIDNQLTFWSERSEGGHHLWFAIFRHGPLSFFRNLTHLLRTRGQVRGGERRAAELVEKRVLFFRLLRSSLYEALARVQGAASLLHLLKKEDGAGEIDLFSQANESIAGCLQGIVSAYDDLDSAVSVALSEQGDILDHSAHHRTSSRMTFLSEALTKVLRMPQTTPGDHSIEQKTSEGRPLRNDVSTGSHMRTSFQEAQRAVGFSALLPSQCTVRDACAHAQGVAQRLRASSLIELPRWVEAPTRFQRHWILFVLGGAATGYCALFVYKHSILSGSHDVEEWTAQGVHAVGGMWKEHVLAPLNNVRGELFNTFRRRPAIVTLDDYEAERDSLGRMLEEFKRDRKGLRMSREAESGMDLLMRSYEDELRRPLKNLIGGDLARCLLIQVQKLKVDSQAAMLEIDQILRANELSISLVAAIPAFLIAGAALYAVSSWITPSPPDPRREALPLRMAVIDVERALTSLAGKVEGAHMEEQGEFLFRLGLAWDEAARLFARHRGILRSANAEWSRLKADFVSLATPGPVKLKVQEAERLMRSYAVLQR